MTSRDIVEVWVSRQMSKNKPCLIAQLDVFPMAGLEPGHGVSAPDKVLVGLHEPPVVLGNVGRRQALPLDD